MKICKTCKHSGPLSDFPPQKGGNRGRRPICRTCFNTWRRSKRKTWKYKKTDRNCYLRTTYGLTESKYLALLAEQSGVCAICACPPEQSIKGVLAVDHDHATGKVRGLLCGLCNSGIGKLKDNASLLRAAADYLDKAT